MLSGEISNYANTYYYQNYISAWKEQHCQIDDPIRHAASFLCNNKIVNKKLDYVTCSDKKFGKGPLISYYSIKIKKSSNTVTTRQQSIL